MKNMDELRLPFIVFGEDDTDDIDMLRETFKAVDEKFELYFIDKGKKLITFLKGLPDTSLPCLVVLDYNMPELNGAEILQLLEVDPRYKKIPKVIWSTSGSATYKNLCLQHGAADYLTKPTTVKALQEAAAKMLSFCASGV